MAPPGIEDYGIVGDGRSAALVSRDGSIDWLCWPRFESPSFFGALLDPEKGGFWRIGPTGPARTGHGYAGDTNVLVTVFETESGSLRLTDFMSVAGEEDRRRLLLPEHELLRIVECPRGEVEIESEFRPAPDYARRRVPMRARGHLGLRLEVGRNLYSLRADRPAGAGDAQAARFRLRAGEKIHFSLTFDAEAPAVFPPVGQLTDEALRRTADWWRRWSGRCHYDGPYRDAVVRSLLVVKLLGFAPSGAIVAAPTTSLPERVRGDLNWDYRFCWLRDASMTVRALLSLGHRDEAAAFAGWLLHSTRLTRPALGVLYDVYGRLPDDEQELDHLAGFRGSRPVRIGNAAAGQLQLDGFGEVIDAVAALVLDAPDGGGLDRETQGMLAAFGEYVCRNWPRPDQGIWEPREPPRHHTHSRVMCWRALDRLLALHRAGQLARIPVERFAKNRDLIRDEVERRGFSAALGSYTQTLDGETVDAVLLRLGAVGFAAPGSPRMRGTHARIVERLRAGPGLLYRYEESLSAREGAFGICSPWEIEHLAEGGGALAEAESALVRFLERANGLGLFAEEIDPESGAPIGNFPQAYTHVGVISAALAIERRRAGEVRPGSDGRTGSRDEEGPRPSPSLAEVPS